MENEEDKNIIYGYSEKLADDYKRRFLFKCYEFQSKKGYKLDEVEAGNLFCVALMINMNWFFNSMKDRKLMSILKNNILRFLNEEIKE